MFESLRVETFRWNVSVGSVENLRPPIRPKRRPTGTSLQRLAEFAQKVLSIGSQRNHSAQVTIEFTFCIIIVLLLLFGTIRAVVWVGQDLAERRQAHDSSLTAPIDDDWGVGFEESSGPLKQLTTDFYDTKRMNLVFNKWEKK